MQKFAYFFFHYFNPLKIFLHSYMKKIIFSILILIQIHLPDISFLKCNQMYDTDKYHDTEILYISLPTNLFYYMMNEQITHQEIIKLQYFSKHFEASLCELFSFLKAERL